MWRHSRVAPLGTHHVVEGKPLYERRFRSVLPFHDPGLAPVEDDSGAYHVTPVGLPAYEGRFLRTFGFYEGLSAVVSSEGWHHVRPDGTALYAERYAWTGNFQGGRCTVRLEGRRYRHIRPDGTPAYTALYRYAGDFREGSAVVQREDGLSVHIDQDGQPVHKTAWDDLDIYHKGFARARDRRGWVHIDRQGRPLYERRYAMIEPFYNGQARVEEHDGRRWTIDETGQVVAGLRLEGPPLARKSATCGSGIEPRIEAEHQGVLVRDRYVVDLERPLARSINGAIYRGWDRSESRPVLLRTRRGGAFAAREEEILRALAGTRGAPPCYDAFTFGESRWIVMEPLPGRALGKRFSCPKLSPMEGLDCVAQVLTTLHVLHGAGFLHTDIQPTNVLREIATTEPTLPCQTWLIDYELSVPIGRDGAWEGEIYWGLWDFVPPEQLAPIGRLTAATDTYAVGALLYAITTGGPPFLVLRSAAVPGDWGGVRRCCLASRSLPVSLESVHPLLQPLITRALAFDPSQRFPSASTMLVEVRRTMDLIGS